MKKTIAALAIGAVLLVFALPVFAVKPADTPNNGNSHPKATGTVTWTARGTLLPGLVTSFDAHDLGAGQVDRGTITTYRPSDTIDSFNEGTITIDIKCVKVEGNEAWFAGVATSGTGGYSSFVNDVFLYWVNDEATPGSLGDKIGGRSYSDINTACGVVDGPGWRGSGTVTDGNLVVH